MTDGRGPRHGRHASPDDGWGVDSRSRDGHGLSGVPEQRSWDVPAAAWQASGEGARRLPQGGGFPTDEQPYRLAGSADGTERAAGARRRASGLLERYPDRVGQTGPMPEWRHRPDRGNPPRPDPRSGPDDDAPDADRVGSLDDRMASRHPSSPLPPMPPGVWSKLHARADLPDDEPTAAADSLPALDGTWTEERWADEEWSDDEWSGDEWSDRPHDHPTARRPHPAADEETQAHPALHPHDELGPHDDWDLTGGLDVIGAHVEEERRRGWFSRSRHVPEEHRLAPHDDLDASPDAHLDGGLLDDEDIPIDPYDPRPQRRRKRRKRAALVVCLVLLAGLVGGVVVGGQKIWGLFSAQDYTGPGTGSVQIRVHEGDTLTDIGQTMVDDGVIASVRPFVKAAEADPQATAIAPGMYGLRHHMSGKAALDLLLQPSSRLMSRVTVPEGMTVKQTLQRLAQGTGRAEAELQAAAAKPAALGLPAYAHGSLEGFLYPATYDFEPGTTPTQMLSAMVQRGVQILDQLQIPESQRLAVVTKASIVQAESGSAADMPKIARVLDNRLAKGMKLQLDTTVNYATGKSGVTTSAKDRNNPSPYNTYLHAGLPPGPISNPGEQALRAVLAPAAGNWLYFVVVNPDTGETRFAATAAEHQKNVALFQRWLRAHPGG